MLKPYGPRATERTRLPVGPGPEATTDGVPGGPAGAVSEPTAVDPLDYARGSDDPSVAIARGRAALARLTADVDLEDGLAPSVLLGGATGLGGGAGARFLADLRRRLDAARPAGAAYPWQRDVAVGASHARSPGRPRLSWRPREDRWRAREPEAYLERLRDPLAIVDTLELLARLEAIGNPAVAATARQLREEATPVIEGRVASWILGSDAWRDTFGLWVATERSLATGHLHALLVAVAARYATQASRMAGLVCGNTDPFHGVELVSASAHLALGLWNLGLYPTLIPGIVDFVGAEELANGSWRDPGQPPDVLTTLAAAEVMGRLVPDWDPSATAAYLSRLQEPEGWWRALDPEVPHLTAAVLEWLERAQRPFHERFAWPGVQKWDRDRKTRIPTYTYFSDAARVIGGIPALRDAAVPLLFCDLAGFKELNNAAGQLVGDEVLRCFAGVLGAIPFARAIRDGGDEFIVIGAPGHPALLAGIEAFREAWPRAFRAEFGSEVPEVVPRLLVTTTTGGGLMAARERLGRLVGEVKVAHPEPGSTGVLVEV